MAIRFGQLLRGAGRAVAGYQHGRLRGRALRLQEEFRKATLARSTATADRGDRERAALDRFLTSQPEGAGLGGLPPGAATSIYRGRVQDRQPQPSDITFRQAQERRQVRAQAEGEAFRQVRTHQPRWKEAGVQQLAVYLRERFPALPLADAEQVAELAMGQASPRRRAAGQGGLTAERLLQNLGPPE